MNISLWQQVLLGEKAAIRTAKPLFIGSIPIAASISSTISVKSINTRAV